MITKLTKIKYYFLENDEILIGITRITEDKFLEASFVRKGRSKSIMAISRWLDTFPESQVNYSPHANYIEITVIEDAS